MVGWVVAFPAAALGQPVPDHLSRVMVLINGETAPDNTEVTAIMDGEEVAIALTTDGVAFIKIPDTGATTGKEIHFMIGDRMADEVDTWEQADTRTRTSRLQSPPTSRPRLSRPPVEAAGEHRRASGSRRDRGDGLDGRLVAATALTANGAAIIRIEGDGSDTDKAISFTIRSLTGE